MYHVSCIHMNTLCAFASVSLVTVQIVDLTTMVIPAAYVPFTSTNTVTVSGQSANLNGVYTCTSSAEAGSAYATRFCWLSSGGAWASPPLYATNTYTGSTATTVQSVGSVMGEWNQIVFPSNLVCKKYVYRGGDVAPNDIAKSWCLLGSTDGTTWAMIDSVTSNTATTPVTRSLAANATAYRYYRMIIRITGDGGSYGFAKVAIYI